MFNARDHVAHFMKCMDKLVADAGDVQRRARAFMGDTRDERSLADAQDMAAEQAKGRPWGKCTMCTETDQPLNGEGLCPSCVSDMQVDETERNG